MGQTTVDKVGRLEGLYQIAGDDARAFLAERPETVDFLVEARPHIEKQFGRGVLVEIRTPHPDPEEPNEQADHLLAMIKCDLDPADRIRFDRFWDEWWCDASAHQRAFPITFANEYGGEPES
jgi:hypothetical protein